MVRLDRAIGIVICLQQADNPWLAVPQGRKGKASRLGCRQLAELFRFQGIVSYCQVPAMPLQATQADKGRGKPRASSENLVREHFLISVLFH
jgi:hypothetical protein